MNTFLKPAALRAALLTGAAMLAVHPLTGAAYPVRGFQRLLLICLRCL